MCGICGKYYFHRDRTVAREMLIRMTKSLYSRGPDEEGLFVNNNVGLGVRRLSIIDKKHGKQPMFNENKTICHVFNGEIYNYKQLRRYLLDKGHILTTDCDSEVIGHMYEEFGEFFVEKLHGMFSIALLDLRTRRLMLVRDRIGIKPFYFSILDDSLVFSSSVNSLIQDGDIPTDFDLAGINCYFSYNYFPDSYTPLRHVKKLLPGCYLICDCNGVELKEYWKLHYVETEDITRSKDSYVEEFRVIFDNSIKTHIQADVPVGIFLSGGLDSSGLTFSVSKYRNIDTFNICFREESFDERQYAYSIAKHCNTRHHAIMIAQDLPRLLMDIVPALDVPIGEASFLPTIELANFAKNHVGVILSGEGADELFGGYETYKADILANFLKDIPPLLKQSLLPRFIRLFDFEDTRLSSRYKAELFLKGINDKSRIAHYVWREVFSKEAKKRLYGYDFYTELAKDNIFIEPYEIFKKHFYAANSDNNLERAMYFDTKSWLPGSILQRVDMASMYHSLEVRVPFLDDDLIEFAYRLPLGEKIHNMKGKYLLRKAFKNRMPKAILKRSKQGFSVPVSKWLRDELKDFFIEITNGCNKKIDFFLNREHVLALFNEHVKGNWDYGRQLWSIAIFILWLDSFLRKSHK